MNLSPRISPNPPFVLLKNHHTTRTPELPTNQKGNVPITIDPDPRRHRSPFKLTFYVDGRPKRKFFPSHKEAEAYWVNHKRLQKKLGGLASSADPADIILLDRLKRKLPDGIGLDQAIDFFVVHRPQHAAPPLGEAIDTLVTLRRDSLKRSGVHVSDLKTRLAAFRRAFGDDRPLLYFTKTIILDWLLSLRVEPRTMRNYRNALGNFFNYWHGRKCLPSNPMKEITKADLPAVKGKRKIILSPVQARAFMAAVLETCPEHIPYYAFQFFAGMRDSQAARMHWDYVKLDQRRIVVPLEICKTEDDWILQDLPAALWDWLLQVEDRKGFILAPTWKQWGRLRDSLKSIRPEDGQVTDWPWNALRRSFCTYDMTLNESGDKTAAKLQHQSPRRLYRSYLSALRTKAEATEYFSTTPKTVRGLWLKLLARVKTS